MKKPLTNKSGDVREVSGDDMLDFRPAHEVDPEFVAHSKKVRGLQKKPTKESVSIRLSPEVVEFFRGQGRGWQSKVDDILKSHVSSHR
ncbi:hypothetical protein IMCC1989_1781 [gamma proteobacterium IMCC1989]|nr:hypothetical protein IMCC1989_1781 [gamma proteobacterium IMCC1989]